MRGEREKGKGPQQNRDSIGRKTRAPDDDHRRGDDTHAPRARPSVLSLLLLPCLSEDPFTAARPSRLSESGAPARERGRERVRLGVTTHTHSPYHHARHTVLPPSLSLRHSFRRPGDHWANPPRLCESVVVSRRQCRRHRHLTRAQLSHVPRPTFLPVLSRGSLLGQLRGRGGGKTDRAYTDLALTSTLIY